MEKSKRIISGIMSGVIISASISSSVLSFSLETEETVQIQPKDKISDELTELIAESQTDTETYPVVIWMKEAENFEVEESIEEAVGFSLDFLDVEYSAPSDELIQELAKAADGDSTEYLNLLMEKHLEMTETVRAEEEYKTEQYLEAKREIVSDIHLDMADSAIERIGIAEDKVCFKSQYAPMMICNLTADEIEVASQDENIQEIVEYEYVEGVPCAVYPEHMSSAKEALGIDKISNLGLTGDGVKIGFYELDHVAEEFAESEGLDYSKVTVVATRPKQNYSHATYCAAIAAGYNGVAPDAFIYSSTDYNDAYHNPWEDFEKLISNGVSIINRSSGLPEDVFGYSFSAKYIDSIISNTNVTVVCSTGNNYNDNMNYPASAYNCIAVNGFSYFNYADGKNTKENVLNNYTYKHGNGCFKPDVIAPSLNNGTSVSAPYITGMIALLFQYKPNLKTHPEAVKSILLASCHEKCVKYDNDNGVYNLNETMEQGLTDRQGAGIPNMYRMISIVAQHSYGYGSLNSGNNYQREVQILQPKYGASNINVSMSYLQTNVKLKDTSTCDDYDITLSNPSFSSDKSSANSNSSTEMIYTSLISDNNYKLTIKKYKGTMENVRYGYAWSTDNTIFYPTRYEEGLYYIKNVKSGKYLTMNNSTLQASQATFTGDSSQCWVLNVNNIALQYYLQSANGTEKNLEIGNLITGEYYKATGSSTSTTMYLFNNSDGTFSFERFNSTNGYRLGVYNNSLNSAVASWYKKDISNLSQKWYLEPVGYKRGDVNMDGSITKTDAELTLNIYSSLSAGSTVTNIKKYLADYDGNGMVTSSDASAILALI